MDMRKKLHGAEHPDTLTSMGNLATLYCYQLNFTLPHVFLQESARTARNPGGILEFLVNGNIPGGFLVDS
ncbi:hypothetical protein BYT27DRAFT_7188403 [Phlegmacium glaucopus]|nr:hypothetical protein BYT27DRAFT_7188403 [Phlegmacium glaucopus]